MGIVPQALSITKELAEIHCGYLGAEEEKVGRHELYILFGCKLYVVFNCVCTVGRYKGLLFLYPYFSRWSLSMALSPVLFIS